MRVSLLALVMCCCAGSAPVLADAFKTPAVRLGPSVSVQGYGAQNASCSRWTNGCVLCARDGAGVTACSTPGIACEPHGIT